MSGDDHRLIAECRKGQSAAFGELVRRHQDRLFNTVFRLLDCAEDAQDVVQEAFLHAYESLDRFKGDSQFFTWLYRIAVNSAISLKRKQRPTLSIHGDPEGQGSVPEPHMGSARGVCVFQPLKKTIPAARASFSGARVWMGR